MAKLFAVLAVASACLVTPATAQTYCGDYSEIVAVAKKNGEALIAQGQVSGGGESGHKAYIELWASEKGSFSLLFRRGGSKIACFMATGEELTGPHFGTSI